MIYSRGRQFFAGTFFCIMKASQAYTLSSLDDTLERMGYMELRVGTTRTS
jgi:hypothetical protein